jgi:hypothetical protein
MSESVSGTSDETNERKPTFRKIRIHKIRPHSAASNLLNEHETKERNRDIDRRIAELIPGIADLSVSSASMPQTLSTASEIRKQRLEKEVAHRDELIELSNIFDMSIPNPVDCKMPEEPWSQQLRPPVRKIVLSPYQYEMINYQRMLLRKNIWYYRDRMSIPRGPCPLHVLKDAWVQGCIDENTLVWGQGLYDWLPAKNVKLLLPMIRTPEGML